MAPLAPAHTALLGLSLVALLYVLRWLSDKRRYDVARVPSAPRRLAHWLWGHELLTFEGEATETYTRWAALCGPLFRIKGALFHPDIIVAADPAAVQHIFQNVDDYVKSPAFRPPVANVLGKGLVWAEGDDHKMQRRILAPAFSPEAIKGMADDISECSEKLESRLTNHVLAAGGAATVNIIEYASTATLDIIGRVAFGHDFKAGTSTEAREIRASWEGHVNTGLGRDGFVAMLVLRALPFVTPLLTRLPLEGVRAGGRIREITTRLALRLVESGAVNEKGRDIMSILMKAQRDADKLIKTSGGKGKGAGRLTAMQIVDNVNTFILVGHETTAGTLAFTILELARNPAVQARLRDEVRNKGRDLSYDDLHRLPYLDAVVKEGLRLHPASPQTERVALRDDVLPLSTPIKTADGATLTSIRVRAGQVFHIPFTTMHVSPAAFGPDAALFNPSRWLSPSASSSSGGAAPPGGATEGATTTANTNTRGRPHGWAGLATFCDGPRNCIGYRLALLELKTLLATLVRALEFHETTADVRRRISPTLQPVVDGRGGLLPVHVTLAAP